MNNSTATPRHGQKVIVVMLDSEELMGTWNERMFGGTGAFDVSGSQFTLAQVAGWRSIDAQSKGDAK